MYSYDDSMALEAVVCARRAMDMEPTFSQCEKPTLVRAEQQRMQTTTELLRHQSTYLSRVYRILGGLVPNIASQSFRSLVLEYGPWARLIDEADAQQEAKFLRDWESRTAVYAGKRMTRNSQRQDYARYLALTDGQRGELYDTAFRVDDTLPR